MINLLALVIQFIVTVSILTSHADTLESEMEIFRAHQKTLLEMGVPNDPFVLNYLTLEIFYNTPYRPTVAATSPLKILDSDAGFTKELLQKFKDAFPEIQWVQRLVES